MVPISLRRIRFALLPAFLGPAVIAGCGDPLGLPPARFENRTDTVTIFALRGTDIALPSAYDLVNRTAARTDRAQLFDFAFDIDSGGAPVLMPAALFGVGDEAGIAMLDTAFTAITTAPLEGFVTDGSVPIATEDVFVARSRNSEQQCVLAGQLPRYGKFRVLQIDGGARSVTFEALVNANCGFRNLEPGVPES